MEVKNVESGMISHITLEKWLSENLLGIRFHMERDVQVISKRFDQTMPNLNGNVLYPEYIITSEGDLVVNKESIPESVHRVTLTHRIKIPYTDMTLVINNSYNISPWDLNSVILVSSGDLHTQIEINRK